MKVTVLALFLLSTSARAEQIAWQDSFPGDAIGMVAKFEAKLKGSVAVPPPPTPEGYERFSRIKIDQIPKYTEWYNTWLDGIVSGMELTGEKATEEKRSITYDLVLSPVLSELASDACVPRDLGPGDTVDSMISTTFTCLKEQDQGE
jgi:hypothetical protein